MFNKKREIIIRFKKMIEDAFLGRNIKVMYDQDEAPADVHSIIINDDEEVLTEATIGYPIEIERNLSLYVYINVASERYTNELRDEYQLILENAIGASRQAGTLNDLLESRGLIIGGIKYFRKGQMFNECKTVCYSIEAVYRTLENDNGN